jgi:hypothetical protein
MTLIELLVATVTAAILVTVCAQVLLIGIKTYNYAARQTASLTATRKILAGDGSRLGVLASSRDAYAFSSLQSSSVALLSGSSGALTNYYVTNGNFYHTTGGSSVLQATGVSSLSLNYYMATNGIISSTTVLSSATMVTALVRITPGTAGTQYSYPLFSGAELRNHP